MHIYMHISRICLLAHKNKQPIKKNVFGVYLYQKVCPFFSAFKSITLVDKTDNQSREQFTLQKGIMKHFCALPLELWRNKNV